MPEQVFLQNRNVVLEFPDGTPDDVIKKTIKREYPMTGEEVAGQMMVNPDWFLNDATLDEYERYREWKGEQADNMSFFGRATQTASDAAAAAADIIKNLGGAVKGTAKDPAGAALSLWDAGKIGTNDLVQVMQQVVHFETDDTYEEWLDGKEDTAANRADWKHRLTDDFSREQDKIRYFSKTREKAIKDTSNPEAARGFAEVLDLSTFVGGFLAKPFAAAAAKASKKAVGDTAIALGSGMSRTGDTLAGIADRSAEALGQGFTKATGVTPETGKALAYSTGVGGTLASGAAMPLAAGYGAVRGMQLGGRVLAEAGEGVHRGIGREGFFGGAAARLEPGSGAQRLATGLSYADPLLEYGVRAAGGAAAGGAFGGALGALAEGWEGFGAGLGGGIALGGIGGGLYRGFEGLTGAALRDKRASDVKNYMDSLSGSDRSKFEQFIEMRGSRGTDEAANILDTASFIRGMLSDDTKEVRTIYVADAESGLRGKVVSLTESDGVPTITINLAKAKDGYSANYTMGHELWHAMSKIEQLSPMAENIRREIAGLWVDGKVLEEGMLPAATFSKYFDDYVKKLPVDQQRAVAEKYVSPQSRAEYVADEIAAEHMAALVTGGTKGRKRYDTMLKAFDTPTQKALDAIILRNSGGVLGRMATRLSEAGFAPGKSFLFPEMGKASPVLNAMMRDMIRARKNLGERIVASDETFNGKKLHTAIRKQDFKHFQKELDDLGLLKSDGKGGKVMKDDKDIAIEEEASEQALRGILRSGSEGGMRIEVDESGNEVVRGNRFSPDQISAIQESATILPTTKRNVAAFNQAVESGSIMDMTYYAATRRTKSRLTGNYTSRYSSGIKRSRREVLPYSIEASKAGNIFVRAVDWTTLWNDTATMAMSGKLGAWDNNHQAFLRDFKEYLDNLSGLTPERSAARFGRDKADMMHDLLTAQKHGGGKYTKSFRLDRMDGLTPTGEKAMMSEQAYQLSKQRFMPDDGTVRAEPDQTFKLGNEGVARFMPDDSSYLDAANRGDTATAQRMVDQAAKAAGYTIPATHRTSTTGITVFDHGIARDELGRRMGLGLGAGKFYFSGGRTGFINPDKPVNVEAHLKVLNPISEKAYKAIVAEEGGVKDMADLPGGSPERDAAIAKADAKVKAIGHDGIVQDYRDPDGRVVEYGQIAVFDPNQIKSADPITRDDAGNVIPLSERFQSGSDDIRFMPDIPDLRPRGAAERRVYQDADSFKAKGKQPRNPELAVAAYRLFKGKISHEQFADIVDVLLPWDVIGGPPDVPSAGKIKKYLASAKYDKRRKFNLSKRNIDGQTVEVRIDIPAWEKSAPLGDPTYVVTLHEPVPDTATKVGETITYDGVAVVDNPTFVVRAISGQGGPIMIAMGKGKTPLATVKGSYKKLKPKELEALLPQLSDSSVWTEAGFNPLRSSDFTDVRTKQSVVGGDTAVMVGNRVFVKNAKLAPKPTGVTGKRSNDMSPKSRDVADFRFMPDIGGQDSLGMFSAAERATVDLKQERGSASQMLAMIKKAGVKDEEIAELGLDKFLEGNRKVSKDEIVDYLVENQITVEETVLRGLHDFAAEDVGIGDISQRARVMIDNYRDQRHSVEYMREDVDYMKDDLRDYELEGLLKYIDYVEKNGHPEKKVYSPTKFEGYVEPGADEGSYRELLLRLPANDLPLLLAKNSEGKIIRTMRLPDTDPQTKAEYISEASSSDLARENPGLTFEYIEGKADYTGGHYGEHPNVLAHVRFNDRISEYGKTLFLEEIQSDWHQDGRKKGYSSDEARRAAEKAEQEFLDFDKKLRAKERTRAEINEAVLSQWNMFYDIGTIKDVKLALKWIKRGRLDVPGENLYRHTPEAILDEIKKINNQIPVRSDKDQAKLVDLEYKADEARRSVSQIPDAPFKTSWHELSMKRMISYAAKNGYDAIAWTKGETQANRYGTEEIAWVKTSPNTWKVKAVEQRGGEADGVNIEEAARAQGILKEGGTEVYGPGDLKRLIETTITRRQRSEFSPENYEGHVDKMTDRIWSRMQSEDAGTSLPRKEGMEGFYDRMLPKMKTWKKLGLKVEEGVFDTGDYKVGKRQLPGRQADYHLSHRNSPDTISVHPTAEAAWAAAEALGATPAHIVKLTPEVKAKVLDTGIARFMPDASVPGAEKNSIGWSMILSKAGKWRVYDPSGALAGIAGSKAVAERIFRTKYKRELRKSSLAK